MKKLISMVETVPEHPHAKFLQQTPTLGMFVPTDEEGNVLEEPVIKNFFIGSYLKPYELIKYQQAEQRVIFEGFKYKREHLFYLDDRLFMSVEDLKNITIEDLVPYNLIIK